MPNYSESRVGPLREIVRYLELSLKFFEIIILKYNLEDKLNNEIFQLILISISNSWLLLTRNLFVDETRSLESSNLSNNVEIFTYLKSNINFKSNYLQEIYIKLLTKKWLLSNNIVLPTSSNESTNNQSNNENNDDCNNNDTIDIYMDEEIDTTITLKSFSWDKLSIIIDRYLLIFNQYTTISEINLETLLSFRLILSITSSISSFLRFQVDIFFRE